MRSNKDRAETSAEATAPKNGSQEKSYCSPHDKSNQNLYDRWFSKLLRDARDEARAMGNIRYTCYLEELLRSSNNLMMGGEAA